MRTIKFRVWDKRGKKFLDGCFIGNDGKIWEYDEGSWTGGWHEFNNVIFSQSTGILDKKGIEIWEGDLLKHEYRYGLTLVEWGEFGDCCVNGIGFNVEHSIEDLEVVGNIYQNPELLKN